MFIKPDNFAGVGINYRSEIASDILKHQDYFDFIEVNTERLFNQVLPDALQDILHAMPVTLHGMTLSIGTKENLSPYYLDLVKKVLNKVNCLWLSDHIALTKMNDREFRQFVPLAFTKQNALHIAKQANIISQLSHHPFLLENITYYYIMPMSDLSEVEFINTILHHSDCGLLLDLNNLYVNSKNHLYDPYQFLDELFLDRVIEVHLAGSHFMYDMFIDTHASAICKEVLLLFEYLCKRTTVNGVVIERDDRLDDFSELLKEVNLVKGLMKKIYHSNRE